MRAGLIEVLKERGHAVVLASSAKSHEVDHYLDLLDARELVDGWTTSADVEHTKPHPDLVAAGDGEGGWRRRRDGRRLDLGLHRRASAAVSRRSALLTGGFSEQELREAGARASYSSRSAELIERLDETPLAAAGLPLDRTWAGFARRPRGNRSRWRLVRLTALPAARTHADARRVLVVSRTRRSAATALVDEIVATPGRPGSRGDDRVAGARGRRRSTSPPATSTTTSPRPGGGSRPRSRPCGRGGSRPRARSARRTRSSRCEDALRQVPGRRGDHRRPPTRVARPGSRRTCSSARAASSTVPITYVEVEPGRTAPAVRDVREVSSEGRVRGRAARPRGVRDRLPAADADPRRVALLIGPARHDCAWLLTLRRLPGRASLTTSGGRRHGSCAVPIAPRDRRVHHDRDPRAALLLLRSGRYTAGAGGLHVAYILISAFRRRC